MYRDKSSSKILFIMIFLAEIFFLPAFSAFAEDADAVNWSWKAEENFFSVTMQIDKGFHAYAEKTSVLTSPEVPFSETPSSSTITEDGGKKVKVYDGGNNYTWKIKLSDLDYPLTIGAEYQVCGETACYLPQTIVLARFKNEDALKKDVFTVPGKAACYVPQTTVLARFKNEDALKKNVFTVPEEEPDEIFLAGSGKNGNDDALQKSDVVFMPDFQILRSAEGYLPPADFIKFLDDGKDEKFFSFDDKGIILSIILAVLGGIALNFTPCVLPLIPVNLAIIGAADGSRSSRIIRGLVYGLGMMLSYGTVGIFASLTGSMFGMLDASWLFNAAVSLVFVFLSLAMFDVTSIDLSRFRTARTAKTFRLGGVFIMGALSSILAGACVAPVVIAVILRSASLYAEGVRSGLLLPFALGAGMALPWPIAAAGISVLPAPGKWMTHVKRVLGIFIFALAAWYACTAVRLYSSESAFRSDASGTENASGMVASALRRGEAEGKNVLIDFGASWCKSCSAMEAKTLEDAEVKKALENFVFVKVSAEDPAEEATARLLEMFDVRGLPKFVIVSPVKGI